jgi:hypothetical protein
MNYYTGLMEKCMEVVQGDYAQVYTTTDMPKNFCYFQNLKNKRILQNFEVTKIFCGFIVILFLKFGNSKRFLAYRLLCILEHNPLGRFPYAFPSNHLKSFEDILHIHTQTHTQGAMVRKHTHKHFTHTTLHIPYTRIVNY